MPSGDDKIDPIGGPKPSAPVDKPEAAAATEATSAVATPTSPDLSIAESLRTGAITPEQAQSQIIDEVVRNQLGPDAPAELYEQVRAEVEALLVGDPALEALLKP